MGIPTSGVMVQDTDVLKEHTVNWNNKFEFLKNKNQIKQYACGWLLVYPLPVIWNKNKWEYQGANLKLWNVLHNYSW
jgi:hypothetical protein